MNLTAILTFTFVFAFLLFLWQRTEPKKRLIVLLILLIPGELIRRLIVFREANTEGVIAFILAVILNFAFYLFIGRYNPVAKSDEIRVIKMDE